MKWNSEIKEYEPYKLPIGASAYETEMDKEINCASCGEPKEYGVCYTSRFIHTPAGFGYMVCEDCYTKERNEERKWMQQ